MLCEFRARLAEQDGAADQLLQLELERLVEASRLKAEGGQRTDATHVLTAVRTLSRLDLVGETLRAALEELAEAPRLAGAADRAGVGPSGTERYVDPDEGRAPAR